MKLIIIKLEFLSVQVRDYRVFIEFPVINKVPLEMTLASLAQDMSNMSEQFSYKESGIGW